LNLQVNSSSHHPSPADGCVLFQPWIASGCFGEKVESYYAHFPDCMIVRFYYLFIALITTLLNLLPAMGCRVDVAAGLNTQ